jgi:ADP-ribose pyrophosphatase
MTEPAGSADAGPAGDGSSASETTDGGAGVDAAADAGGAEAAGAIAAGPADLTETVVDSRVLHRGRYLQFRIDTIQRADGSRAERDVVGHPGAVAILALDEADRVLLVRQFRSPAGRILLEVPAGTLDVDAETGLIEDPAIAAPRELEEETGYRADSWQHLTSFWTAPGFATELMHLYLATGLRPAHGERLGPDEDERLELERIPWQEAIAAAARGEIMDAKSLVALLWLDRITQPEASAAAGENVKDAVEGEFAPSFTETTAASLAVVGRSRGTQVLGIAMGAVGILTLLVDPAPGILLTALAILFVTGLFIVPFVAIAWWRRRDLLRQPTRFLADRDGVDYRNALMQSHMTWPTFTRLRETRRFFLLETGVQTVFLPKRALGPEQLGKFRRLVAEAGFGPDGRRRSVAQTSPPERNET